MNMPPPIEWLPLTGTAAGGFLLGLVFFGGLYWTTEHVIHCKRPAAVLMASLLTRGAIVVTGFYWLMDGAPVRALAALGGFIIARAILVRTMGRKPRKPGPEDK